MRTMVYALLTAGAIVTAGSEARADIRPRPRPTATSAKSIPPGQSSEPSRPGGVSPVTVVSGVTAAIAATFLGLWAVRKFVAKPTGGAG